MIPSRSDELLQLLVQLRLFTPQQANDFMVEHGRAMGDGEQTLQLMESRGILTSFQAGQIRSDETDVLVLGDYKLLYRNASGSFARVFRAESLKDGAMVGLKLLRQRWANDPAIVTQFRREALLCKRMQHRNIVPIFEVGDEGKHHYFTMEFVEGGNLRDFITIRKKLSPEEAIRCVLDIASGLEYALRLGISHRDMKMTNVLMGTDGVAKLVDFGLAGDDSAVGATNGEDSHRALEYAALEKGTGAPDNDPRTDLFFVGAIFYELLTGQPPYARTRNRDERKRLGRYTNVRPLKTVEPDVPEGVVEIVEKLMQVNPRERHQSPSELVQELRALQQQLTPNGRKAESKKKDEPPTVLCVESDPKKQDVFRKYLTKHGFRVLLLSDAKRAGQRLKNNPPDCIVLMGESIGSGVGQLYQELIDATRVHPIVGLVVLSSRQKSLQAECEPTGSTRVLVQPVTIRDLRKHLQNLLRKRYADDLSSVIDEEDDDYDGSAVARV